MLFNSIDFVYAFFPVVFIVFLVLRRAPAQVVICYLIVASLVFYGWNDPWLILLITGSLLFNFLGGKMLGRPAPPVGRRLLLGGWVAGNLLLLGAFKYTNFAIRNANALGADIPLQDIVLPLAISFFTFQQIAFVVDCNRARACDASFLEYCLFVTFFPQLVAGPIVKFEEFAPQLRAGALRNTRSRDIAIGIAFIGIGLFKKTVLADGVAPIANAVFMADPSGLTSLEVWAGGLAFAFQIYFDFSGYSDIALGLARCFGIVLPVNFASPYKAASIIDFWRRWHITLSRFLAQYLYVPLGGNRRGRPRQLANLMIVMLLGGLWHGAAWTFVAWGGLHGAYLVINHFWHRLRSRAGTSGRAASRSGTAAAILLTFLATLVAWIFFRAEDLPGAVALLGRMASVAEWPAEIGLLLSAPGAAMPVVATAAPIMGAIGAITLLALLLAIVWGLPNTQTLVAVYEGALERGVFVAEGRRGLAWLAGHRTAFAAGLGLLLAAGILAVPNTSEFIYFRF